VADDHPDREAWRSFLWSMTNPERSRQMADHLVACAHCSTVYGSLTRPPHWLGRPLPRAEPMPAEATTPAVRELVAACMAKLNTGGSLSVTSGQELSFYAILGAAVSQLSRARHSVSIIGSPRVDSWVVPSTVEGIQLLFPGPLAPASEFLKPPGAGQVYIIARRPSEWDKLGVKPDLTFPPIAAEQPAFDHFEGVLIDGRQSARQMIALSGLGCDAPVELIQPEQSDWWIVPVSDPSTGQWTPWLSVRGDWSAQQTFLNWGRAEPERARALIRCLVKWANEPARTAKLGGWAARLEFSARQWFNNI